MTNKFKNILLIILSLIVCIFGFLFYNEKKQQKQNYLLFFEIVSEDMEDTINSIDILLNNKDDLEANINRLEEHIRKMDYSIESASRILDYNIYSNAFISLSITANHTVHFERKPDRKMSGFYEDGKLDDVEKEFLKRLKKHLVNSKSKIDELRKSKDTNVSKFNDILTHSEYVDVFSPPSTYFEIQDKIKSK